MGIYPFMFAKYDDFLPIVDQLTKVSTLTLSFCALRVDSLDGCSQEGHKEPYDWDAYAQVYCKYVTKRITTTLLTICSP